ncbi:MAG: helix-turn-helix domain-containing protein [Verrucomicrobia bacterium]|nr:helix-turn-helix domain-containing protein [Verrucomicrobiota bacterium]
MSDGLKKMGETFRTKREEMSLSLKEVENATSIRALYLQAIEEGRISHFLSTAYALGFIRQYANFLGYDSERLGREHPEVLRIQPEKQDFAYGIGTLETRGSPHGGVRWMPNLMWGGIVVATLVAAWYFAKFMGAFS